MIFHESRLTKLRKKEERGHDSTFRYVTTFCSRCKAQIPPWIFYLVANAFGRVVTLVRHDISYCQLLAYSVHKDVRRTSDLQTAIAFFFQIQISFQIKFNHLTA